MLNKIYQIELFINNSLGSAHNTRKPRTGRRKWQGSYISINKCSEGKENTDSRCSVARGGAIPLELLGAIVRGTYVNKHCTAGFVKICTHRAWWSGRRSKNVRSSQEPTNICGNGCPSSNYWNLDAPMVEYGRDLVRWCKVNNVTPGSCKAEYLSRGCLAAGRWEGMLAGTLHFTPISWICVAALGPGKWRGWL